ncbi:MAG: NAD(P)-dependent oxidoreductase, partial [Pseudomonadota bacterium]
MKHHSTSGKIAFLGTGLMGAPMARRLCQAGYQLRVWNRSADKAQQLAEYGATVCGNIEEAVSDASTIITMLAGQSAIESVLLGGGGVRESATIGTCIIDMSSLAPDLSRAHHQTFIKSGFGMLDAPVSGGVAGAEAGTLSIMVGGAKADFENNRSILEAMGVPFLLGEAGAGQVCTIVWLTI